MTANHEPLSGIRPVEGEEMDEYVSRTDGLGVPASLRRASWVMGKPLGEIVGWWRGLTGAHGEDGSDV